MDYICENDTCEKYDDDLSGNCTKYSQKNIYTCDDYIGPPFINTDEELKQSSGKIPWEVYPFTEAEFTCRVFKYGAEKYGAPFTYRKGIPMEKLAAAVIRHATAILSGERIDPESGLLHSAHISAGGLMMISQSISEEGL